ncbi:MAG: formate dehydrogenase accessory sulfurtransferase FdhD [Gordonia sp. (in: high G+C Gram-positive bacteria)]|uniref:formate dehydrogenase accessory sulfurtransferase FdhD n=1 Tax=Gordonia sp. (in: high G+C Gram-positive bacteria) TaxID=84139 RepID=UPI0039E54576
MTRITARRRVTRITVGDPARSRADLLAVEEPLELRIGGRPFTVTMRTPGNDVELVAGLLHAEGVITDPGHLAVARYCAGATGESGENTYNVLDVTLADGVPAPEPGLERNVLTTSACGVCGATSIDAVTSVTRHPVHDDPLRIDPELLAGFPDELRRRQKVFERTGGLHAAALFDGRTGDLLVMREDVGRHNAVDKVLGRALLQGLLPARETVLMVSGRASFELTQKALMAGVPLLAAVSAPSSLAAELAEEAGLTLVGFLRGPSMVVYSGAQRVARPALAEAVGS